MTTIAAGAIEPVMQRQGTRRLGLSGRLIILTLLFMMLAELLIFVPAVASFRRSWVSDRIMGAQMIVLALSGTPNEARSTDIEARLLAGVKGAQAIGVRGPGTRWLLAAGGDVPPEAAYWVDMREGPWWGAFRGLYRTMMQGHHGPTRITAPGPAGVPNVEWVELILDEAPLRQAILTFSRQFLAVSLVMSGITSALLYLALHLLVVRPVQRLAGNVAAFAENPEDSNRIIVPSGRTDEIGVAEQALARMESALATELRQKRRLAELGLAVSKINHELRNILTTAQLLGDRLGDVVDPVVQRVAPRLIATLGRAIDYCNATLAYGRASERAPLREIVPLAPIVEEQLDLTKLGEGHPIAIEADIAPDLLVDADPEQLGRVLLNLIRNSVEALARAKTPDARILVLAKRIDRAVQISVLDNGPGVPERVRDRLFSAFQASERSGGTGLGLPVADELVRLHGGRVVLEESGAGACFAIRIPDRGQG
ncbi:MAG: histidine kinase [Enterovirga sp.]|nr:histidine kinase [Enterovirga sp.]